MGTPGGGRSKAQVSTIQREMNRVEKHGRTEGSHTAIGPSNTLKTKGEYHCGWSNLKSSVLVSQQPLPSGLLLSGWTA